MTPEPDLFDQPTPMQYPTGAGYSNTTTSQAAAESIAESSKGVAKAILARIETHGAMTADQLEQMTGQRAQTITGRVRQLVMAGKLVDTGEVRRTRRGRKAIVWGLAPAGHQPERPRRDVEREQATSLYRAFHRITALGARVASLSELTNGEWLVTLCKPGRDGRDQFGRSHERTMVAAINAACDQVARDA